MIDFSAYISGLFVGALGGWVAGLAFQNSKDTTAALRDHEWFVKQRRTDRAQDINIHALQVQTDKISQRLSALENREE